MTLPDDIAAVWGHTEKDRAMAEYLIEAWGLEVFRGSVIHQAAKAEAVRPRLGPKDFVAPKMKAK